MTIISCRYKTNHQHGFTLIELIMIIVILGILSATIYTRWPVGMEEAAAVKEFKRAVRYAQHKAMTRQFTTADAAWGIRVTANRYTVQRWGEDCTVNPQTKEGCAEADYLARCLNNDCTTSITPVVTVVPFSGNDFVYFNALGEPIFPVDASPPPHKAGDPLTADTTFTIKADGSGTSVTVRQRTGYVE